MYHMKFECVSDDDLMMTFYQNTVKENKVAKSKVSFYFYLGFIIVTSICRYESVAVAQVKLATYAMFLHWGIW